MIGALFQLIPAAALVWFGYLFGYRRGWARGWDDADLLNGTLGDYAGPKVVMWNYPPMMGPRPDDQGPRGFDYSQD